MSGDKIILEDGNYLIAVRSQPQHEDRNPALIVVKIATN